MFFLYVKYIKKVLKFKIYYLFIGDCCLFLNYCLFFMNIRKIA